MVRESDAGVEEGSPCVRELGSGVVVVVDVGVGVGVGVGTGMVKVFPPLPVHSSPLGQHPPGTQY